MNRFDESVLPEGQIPLGDGTGFLIVRVATARGAIPLENAIINVREAAPLEDENADIRERGRLIATVRTDRDGLSPRLALSAPPRALSETPGGTSRPYALYDVEAFLDGYTTNYYQNVPIFDTVTSLQTVDMIPIPEGILPDLLTDPPSLFFRSRENRALEG